MFVLYCIKDAMWTCWHADEDWKNILILQGFFLGYLIITEFNELFEINGSTSWN